MWPNPQETADLVTFNKESLNGKLHNLCSAIRMKYLSLNSVDKAQDDRWTTKAVKILCSLGPKIWSKINLCIKNVKAPASFMNVLKKNNLLHLQTAVAMFASSAMLHWNIIFLVIINILLNRYAYFNVAFLAFLPFTSKGTVMKIGNFTELF